MLRVPSESLEDEHVQRALDQLDAVFIWFARHVDSLHPRDVACLPLKLLKLKSLHRPNDKREFLKASAASKIRRVVRAALALVFRDKGILAKNARARS